MTTEAKDKSSAESIIAAAFGAPKEEIKKVKRETISFAQCGRLKICFEALQFLNDPERPEMGYKPPVPNFVAYAEGYTNDRGYRQDIQLSSEPEDLENFAQILTGVAKFVRETGVAVTRTQAFTNDIGKAFAIFA
ncbi:MAG: hypothetical protein LBG62_02705, partial [Candidatus Methanoplasma sp.]|nr:hypothetical protein [Candidatus Methanoplasma sp.]